ncbi:V-type ATP synthase subunit F [Miniphocaeibacter halophilus]|uniref:V-type ATP synthase subunit F n=1 Tax=Miniphocaeibacter halophilus TaxID=2931922 RepID=A0AC61MPA6_9FIRM|nr:V-type ATP synthase subunit F [Miniphocaeibacter halophilus]QQK07360.1 V-type ATP synthase subunit F [Miniphocaeibacter halophilus]
MKSIVISNETNVILGMELAGIETGYSEDEDEIRKIFTESIENEKYGIVIVTEGINELLSDLIFSHREKGKLPLIVTIPGEDGLKDKDFIMKYVKESLGVKID